MKRLSLKAAGEASGDTGFEAAAADRGRKAEPKAQELSEEAAGEKPESSRQTAAAEPPREEAGLQPSGKRGSVWWERRFAPI